MSVVPRFHTLTIAEVRRETPDAVAVRFSLPPNLTSEFSYDAGQYLTLRRDFAGVELRRCYSLCAAPGSNDLWIGVREEDGGRFSGWLNQHAKPGDTIDIMPPDGRFTYCPADSEQHVLLVAAGSGITPILSIVEEILGSDSASTATVVFINRDAAHIMFKDKLDDLKDSYLNRLRVFHVLSREVTDVSLLSGRFDQSKCEGFFAANGVAPASEFDSAYLCGPEALMDLVEESLAGSGLAPSAIKRELFLNPDSPAQAPRTQPLPPVADGVKVTIILDQRQRTISFDSTDASVLDAARKAGMDVPYACKAGVCATCRAYLAEGEVSMERNQALDQDELDRGYILTCQARPLAGSITVDYDRRSG